MRIASFTLIVLIAMKAPTPNRTVTTPLPLVPRRTPDHSWIPEKAMKPIDIRPTMMNVIPSPWSGSGTLL